MTTCIFCSANNDIDQSYFEAATALTKELVKAGASIVYGGCSSGLMEAVAQTAKQAGGRLIGIVPAKVETGGRMSDQLDVHVPCDNLSDRKALMMDMSDAFIALPGGIGTLDEIFTVAAARTIGYHSKPLIIYNFNGFYDPLKVALDTMQEAGFMRRDWRETILMANTCRQVLDTVKQLHQTPKTE